MDIQTNINKAKEIVHPAKEVMILTHENPTSDSVGSSLALSLGLAGLGKTVSVACPDLVTVELASFVGANKVKSELGNKNFIISLDYIDGSIEKVSYNIEGDKFNLVIEHRPGFEPFSPDKVNYTYGGTNADLIITVDTIHLGGLGKLYEEHKELFASKPILNIDWHPNNSQYGHVNLVNSASSSTAELVAQLLSSLGVKLTQDIAGNLLNAVYSATNNFQSPAVTALAFELAASCLKAGGRRFGPAGEAASPELSAFGTKPQQVKSQVRPHPSAPRPQPISGATQVGQTTPTGTVAGGPTSTQAGNAGTPAATAGQAPEDWLKPKIFKSSSLL